MTEFPVIKPRQLSLDLPFRTARGREDFTVAECNKLAVGWVDRWPDWPNAGLILHGPEGCGKSHLAAVWQGKSKAMVLDDRALDTSAGRAAADRGDALLLEDVDVRLAVVPAWQEALLHLYDASRLAGGAILLTSRTLPSAWLIDLPDLQSRMAALPKAEIALPDDRLLEAVMWKQFNDRQLKVEQDLVRYVLPRIERSFPAIRRFVDRLDKISEERRQKPTRPLAAVLLKDMTDFPSAEDARKCGHHGSGT
ncbi:MAG: DNA replication protein [Rhodospirillaceae bacterium]|nr:DNA replication protein [Rhodospirillaceae bacterium]